MDKRLRIAVASVSGVLAFWAVTGPILLTRNFERLWPIYVLSVVWALGLGALALLGKFDDPASPYMRAAKIVAIGTLAAGALFVAYIFLAGG